MDVNKQPVDPYNNFPGSGIPSWGKEMTGTSVHVRHDNDAPLESRVRALEARLSELEHACRLAGLKIVAIGPDDGSDLV